MLKGARLDERVVRDGLAATRTRAQALIRTGRVLVDDVPVEKPGTRVREGAAIRVRGRERPFVSCSVCFVVPPMKFATEACGVMERCIRGGMPVLLLSAGQAGATAPAPIAGAIVQAVAECLAGVVYVNSLAPGHPAHRAGAART